MQSTVWRVYSQWDDATGRPSEFRSFSRQRRLLSKAKSFSEVAGSLAGGSLAGGSLAGGSLVGGSLAGGSLMGSLPSLEAVLGVPRGASRVEDAPSASAPELPIPDRSALRSSGANEGADEGGTGYGRAPSATPGADGGGDGDDLMGQGLMGQGLMGPGLPRALLDRTSASTDSMAATAACGGGSGGSLAAAVAAAAAAEAAAADGLRAKPCTRRGRSPTSSTHRPPRRRPRCSPSV